MKRIINMAVMLLMIVLMGSVVSLQQTAVTTKAQAGDHYFPETRHNVPAIFYQYWLTHGGLAQQGYPVTDATTEKNSVDGKNYLTQYFERARFEYHPEFKGTSSEVLLGLLGVEVLKCRPVAVGGTSQKDAPGTSDFKFIPRPANSYIKEWCITDPCPDTVAAFAGDAPVLDNDQDVVYHLVDESAFDATNLIAYYEKTLVAAGWRLGNSVSSPPSKGQVFFPPASLSNKVQKASIYFDAEGGKLTRCIIAVVRASEIGNPPDLSLFQGH